MKYKICVPVVFIFSLILTLGVMYFDPIEAVKQATKSEETNTVIVIDPGHGGIDGGASSKSGIMEKDINLKIGKYLAEQMKDYPVTVIMTRNEDKGLYTDDGKTIRQKKREDLLRRKEIMEESNVTLGVSIHLNSFPQDARVYGAQIFYPKSVMEKTDVFQNTNRSKIIAESVQKALEINIQDGRERSAAAKGDILMFKNTNATMILAECGFLSNPDEERALQNAEYQQKIAESIWQGINEILCLKKETDVNIIDSANKGK